MFRKPIQPPASRDPGTVSKEVQPEPAVPPITSEAVWDGHFPDADSDIQASIEYSNQGLRELLANDTLIVTRYTSSASNQATKLNLPQTNGNAQHISGL